MRVYVAYHVVVYVVYVLQYDSVDIVHVKIMVRIAFCLNNRPQNIGLLSCKFININIKGSVQRKLRWVENDVNKSVGAWDCGAGHSFVVLLGFHLVFSIFPFPVSTVQILGEFWNNR
jgi:hypothetical protein